MKVYLYFKAMKKKIGYKNITLFKQYHITLVSVSCNNLLFTRPFTRLPFQNCIDSFCEKCHFGHMILQQKI